MARFRGFIWLAAGLIVALLAGFVAFVTLSRASAQPQGKAITSPDVQVVVAARQIDIRSTLTRDDVVTKKMPVNAVPDGAIRSVDDAVGRITLVDLYQGEVLLSQRLVDPNEASRDGKMALVVADDEVLMALPADDLMSRTGILKPGDQVDLLFSLKFPAKNAPVAASGAEEPVGGTIYVDQTKDKLATFDVLQNLTIAAVVTDLKSGSSSNDRANTAILLTVSPQDALVLKYVKDADGIMDIVLRAPDVDSPFESDPVDIDYLINRYQIPTTASH